MSKIRNTLFYCGLHKEEYEGIRELIDERNFSSTYIVSAAMTAFGIILLALMLLTDSGAIFPYLFIFACGLLFLLIRRFLLKKPSQMARPFCYLQMCSVFIFAIILGCQGANSELPSTSIVAFLALLPLIINDRPIRMFTVVTAFVVISLICSAIFKTPGAHRGDMFNTITCTLVGMGVYVLVSNRNVNEIYLRRKAAETDRLREEKRAADMANAAKSEFLANMSHEIRTPINAVLGMNEMILRETRRGMDLPARDEDAARNVLRSIRGYADNVQSAGHSLLSIINDILDFSRIEAGKLEIINGVYDLGSLINDVNSMISFKAGAKGLDYRVSADESLPASYYGDVVHLRQVITNLLNNAVKYTRSGSVELSVHRLENNPPVTGRMITLVIAVKDTGIGIRKEDLGRLFDKFERIDLQSNSTVEGTGLGLAITKALLDGMGGSIHVESEYGNGSVFTVTLPQMVASAEPVGDIRDFPAKSRAADSALYETFLAPEARILIVDDTQINLKVAASLLEHTKIRIDTALSGAEAVEMCRSAIYDLILMDQRMPLMDGLEALRLIRALPEGLNRETPCICLTADAVNGARERYLAGGFTDYLTKPVVSEELEKMMIRYLPEDKIVIAREPLPREPGRPETADAGEESVRNALLSAGVDPAVGMNYCQNDFSLYRTVLEDYALGAAQRAEELQACCDRKDWSRYGVLIHAVKSTSKQIGAEELSESARRLEESARRQDIRTIQQEQTGVMARYTELAGKISSALHLFPDTHTDEGDIMEFEPDDP